MVSVNDDMHIGVNSAAIEHQRFGLQEGIKVGTWEELLRHLAPGDIVHLGLPVVFEPDDEAHAVFFAGAESREAGIGEVGKQAAVPPGLVDLQMPAIVLRAGLKMVAYWCPAANGEDFMHFDRRVVPVRETRRAGRRGP